MSRHGGDGKGAKSLTLGSAATGSVAPARLCRPFTWIRCNGHVPPARQAELRRFGGVTSGSPSAPEAKQPRTDRSADSPDPDDHQPTAHLRLRSPASHRGRPAARCDAPARAWSRRLPGSPRRSPSLIPARRRSTTGPHGCVRHREHQLRAPGRHRTPRHRTPRFGVLPGSAQAECRPSARAAGKGGTCGFRGAIPSWTSRRVRQPRGGRPGVRGGGRRTQGGTGSARHRHGGGTGPARSGHRLLACVSARLDTAAQLGSPGAARPGRPPRHRPVTPGARSGRHPSVVSGPLRSPRSGRDICRSIR